MRGAAAAVVVSMVCVQALASPKTDAEARDWYEQGQRAYDTGQFVKAAELYTKAYEISGRAGLLFNIAQAHRLAGAHAAALFSYETFLRKAPGTPLRKEVEGFIVEMNAQIEKAKAGGKTAPPVPLPAPETKPEPPPEPVLQPQPEPRPMKIPSPEVVAEAATPAPGPMLPVNDQPRSRPIYKKWWFWTAIGAAAVGATVVVLSTSGGGTDRPGTDLGFQPVF